MTSRRRERAELPLLGWREWVGFPDLGLPAVKGKVDTGARSSALHGFNPEPFEREGRRFLRFTVHPHQRSKEGAVEVEAPLVDHRSVRSSTGEEQVRPVVRLEMQVGVHRFPAEVTITRRDLMGFRLLLGRTSLRGRFLVDPGRSFLLGDRPSAPSPKPGPER